MTDKEMANIIANVKKGFPPDRLNNDMISFYALHSDRLQKMKSKDRAGLTHKPMLTGEHVSSEHNIPPLHSRINSLRFWETTIYFFNARKSFPNEIPIKKPGHRKSPAQLDAFELAKKNVRNEAKYGELGLILDCPDPTGCGGNSDNGNTAKEFFSEKNREAVVKLFKTDDETLKNEIRILHQNFEVILRVINSRDEVKVDLFAELCKETNVKLLEAFPWNTVTETVHRYLGHAAHCIARNNNHGLAQLSESPLESSHKMLRQAMLLLINHLITVFKTNTTI